jgi:hypothetical protein
MRSLPEYLACGDVCVNATIVDFKVNKFTDLTDKVIPFFEKYRLQGAKSKDLADFCRVAELIKNKAHLTASGLEQIRKIKTGMNRGRP